jgi:GNAT superfamily N-acetyltransferase
MVAAITHQHELMDPERFRVRPDVLDRYAGWLPLRVTDPRSVFLVAEREGALVGYLVGTVEPELPIFWVPECGWIHDLWVEPAARRSGVARLLIERAAKAYARIGVQQLRLDTAWENEQARRVFAACGFRACIVEMIRAVPAADRA